MIPFFQSIPGKISKVWDSIKTTASEKWGQFLDVMRGIPEKVGDSISAIGKWFEQLPGKIGHGLGYALGTVTKWGIELSEYLSQKIPEIIENVRKWFSELPTKIYNVFYCAEGFRVGNKRMEYIQDKGIRNYPRCGFMVFGASRQDLQCNYQNQR